MDLKDRIKRSGFSLMEILIAVSIVAILALVTIPIINRQLNKTEEYSYYLAYNTVEKLAGQIVALGDPKDDYSGPSIWDGDIGIISKINKEEQAKKYRTKKTKSTPISSFIATIGNKFTNTQAYILSHFVPKAVAEPITISKEWGSWESDRYDEKWLAYQVCSGKQIKKTKKAVKVEVIDPRTGQSSTSTSIVYTYYTKAEFNNCIGYTLEGDYNGYPVAKHSLLVNDLITQDVLDICDIDNSKLNSLANVIINQTEKPNATLFCTNFGYKCPDRKEQDGTTYEMDVYFEKSTEQQDPEQPESVGENEWSEPSPSSDEKGTCIVGSRYEVEYSGQDDQQYIPDIPRFEAWWCTKNGYNGMTNVGAPYSIDCQCTPPNVVSTNDEKSCVPRCTNDDELPYVMIDPDGNFTGRKKCCATDFNPKSNDCCPEKSLYDPAQEKCECVSGYKMNSSGTKCELEFCPAGSHKTDDGVCVVNPPITQARRFCELITEHWNISDSYCGSFDTNSSTLDVYEEVYKAALNKDGNGRFLSVNSKIGEFKDIKPNIEFANGLKLWILGDKAASIPGLSYYNDNVSKNQNMCYKKNLTSNTQVACYHANGYFCQHENTCLVLDPASQSSGAIKDARTCCSAADYSDLEAAAEPGVNWREDPIAYAISGFTVFVDINGDKGDGTLWDDVYPFYIAADGNVYPAYPLDAPKDSTTVHNLLYDGGNSEKYLPVDVYYYLPTEESRQRKTAFSGVSYARGVCSARKVSKFTPYCLNLGEKFNGGEGFLPANCPTQGGCTSPTNLVGNAYIQVDGKESRNPCDHYNCFVTVRKKLKSF